MGRSVSLFRSIEVWLNGKAVCHHGRLIPGDKTVGPLSWRLELAAPQLKKGRLMEGMVFADHRCLHQIWLIYQPLRVLTFSGNR